MLVTKESKGLHTSDEGFKMALTDALGVAMGKIGVAADIYMGQWDGSKYKDAPKNEPQRNWIAEIKTAPTMEELKSLYKGACSNLEGKEKAEATREKDKRKVELIELGGSSQAQRGE